MIEHVNRYTVPYRTNFVASDGLTVVGYYIHYTFPFLLCLSFSEPFWNTFRIVRVADIIYVIYLFECRQEMLYLELIQLLRDLLVQQLF